MSNGSIRGAPAAYGDQMAAFDRLPPTARKALAYAAFDWAATTVLARHRRAEKGYRTGVEIAAKVKQWDRQRIKQGGR